MIASILAAFASAASLAQTVNVDGAGLTTEYDIELWTNGTNPTGFGDNNLPGIGEANGSEIDAVRARIGVDVFNEPMLFISFSGNLETNFNKLDIFLDTIQGSGQNPLRGDNPDIDFNGLNRMGENSDPNNGPLGPGITFDTAVTANYWIGVTTGNYDPNTELAEVYANYCDLDGQVAYYLGKGTNGLGFLSDGNDPFGFLATVDNSNVAGVTDATSDPNAAAIVDTGWEIGIPMAAIGNPAGAIRMVAFINGTGHDFVSSQIVGGHPFGANNAGEPRILDLSAIEGNQYVTIGEGGGYSLALSGTCPGTVRVEWSGATPRAQQALVFGVRQGSTTIPGGNPCPGTTLGVAGQVRLVDPPGFFSTGQSGSGAIQGNAGAGVCGSFLQLVEGGTCQTSNVAQIP
jgi:hypothetical protein